MFTGMHKKIGIIAVCGLLTLSTTGMASLLPAGSKLDTAPQSLLKENWWANSKITDGAVMDGALLLLARGGGGGGGDGAGGGSGSGGGDGGGTGRGQGHNNGIHDPGSGDGPT
jgi:hypothetical protein